MNVSIRHIDLDLDPEAIAARFWAKVEMTEAGCWQWTAAINSSGTPVFGIKKHAVAATRVAHWLDTGEWITGHSADRRRVCFNSHCVNPQHLEAVDRAEILLADWWSNTDTKTGPVHPYDGALGRCWPWKGRRYPSGYGRSRGRHYAHRAAWFVATGEWPTLFILHSCDRPWCVNPAHLREGTQADNVRDRDERRRGRFAKQEVG